ncbi:hypothetical protein [Gimesia maris]|uniref:hypothetical protein n=1 Tax=Gimesia maris TaxID=122 RepID=UPI003A92CA1F
MLHQRQVYEVIVPCESPFVTSTATDWGDVSWIASRNFDGHSDANAGGVRRRAS